MNRFSANTFKKEYGRLKNLNIAVNGAIQGALYEDNFKQVSEQKKQEIINNFTQSIPNFIEKYGAFLLEIGCKVENIDIQRMETDEIFLKKKVYLSIHKPKQFIAFLLSTNYTNRFKKEIKDFIWLDAFDQIRNNYEDYVENGFLDTFSYREEMFGSENHNFIVDQIKKKSPKNREE